ncbi:SPARC related modular calcium binding-like protein magu isoform X2 [Musca autumnalis]|uniref:SPARC related modular calcium binding-like protein magu isoform X2 n=1 Tax=Musca autumnalis TaxID=221902 RepID=UPI003CE89CF2
MILRSVLLVAIVVIRIVCGGNVKRPELTISECAAKLGECDESKGRPVCGTDDQTYPTRCHLLRVQCSGHQVSLKYRGPCKACAEAREYALKRRNKYPPKFIPRCKPDGTYAPIQCLMDKGCWCSDPMGTPINNTSVRTGKPNCREFGKANVRRSPPRNNGGNRKRPCTQDDRAMFNGHLIRVFQSEYIRSKSAQYQRDRKSSAPLDNFTPPSDTEVMEWKFSQLDVNRNQMLDKNEYRELKKLVKRAVKPKRCGRAFGKFCDVDSDERLSRLEWNSCLSKDGSNRHLLIMGQKHNNNNSHHNNNTKHRKNNNILHSNTAYPSTINTNNNNQQQQQHSTATSSSSTSTSSQQQHHHLNNNIPHHHNNNNNHQNRFRPDSYEDNESNGAAADNDEDSSSQHLDYDDGDDYEETDDDGSSTIFPSIYILKPPTEMSPPKESDSESDCLADQAAALEEKKFGYNLYYVPDCTPDGRFQRIQCYNSTPYCWCVNEDTGKTIQGTWVKHRRPQCDSFYTATRAMKGCPEEKKVVFLKDLKEFLKTKIITGAYAGVNTTNWSSEEERIATLSFVILDKNKNSAFEKKEWKAFRELVNTVNNLRKCGRKLPRYCDVDNDKKITLSEWITCLQTTPRLDMAGSVGAQNDAKQQNTSISDTNSPKLSGSNPLEQYLKD